MHVTSLHTYPAKSCKAIDHVQIKALDSGLYGDRNIVFVDHKGRFLSQRSHPELALVLCHIEEDNITISMNTDSLSQNIHDLTQTIDVQVWGDQVKAYDLGDRIANFLSTYLNQPTRAAKIIPTSMRKVDRKWTQDHEISYSFADGFPYLITNQSSLDELNKKLTQALPMNRFRPNIVIGDAISFFEDKTQQIKIGNIIFQLAKPCSRCTIINIDQNSLCKNPEPLKTLSEEYYNADVKGACFGQNAYIVQGAGEILRVGDRVEIL